MTTGVFNLRLPEELREMLQQSAERRGVSLNAELVFRLGQSFEMQRHVDSYRELTNQLNNELADAHRRSNAQHDVLLQILARDMVIVHKDQLPKQDQLPKRRGEAA